MRERSLETIRRAVQRLDAWVERSKWEGYDPFDGLSAPWARKLTFEAPLLRIALQQGVRRAPVNLRPLLGIPKKRSTKAMGYFASGYLRLYQMTGRGGYLEKAVYCLEDLRRDYTRGYSGYAWGNAFDYQSRGNFTPQGTPTAVWTSFIGHTLVDAYELLGDQTYLDVARSACEFILRDLHRGEKDDGSICISYVPGDVIEIHNASILAGSLLARVHRHTREGELLELARRAVQYTATRQRADGSWYYGEGLRWHWVDGYHTGFVLEALFRYTQATGDGQYEARMAKGMDFYRESLFAGVLPKHYALQTYPVDIQAVAQAIQTFALLPRAYHGDLDWAEQVALWAVDAMQGRDGHFYFRKGRVITNRTACLHWGQATMLCALALLLQRKALAEGELVPGQPARVVMSAP